MGGSEVEMVLKMISLRVLESAKFGEWNVLVSGNRGRGRGKTSRSD